MILQLPMHAAGRHMTAGVSAASSTALHHIAMCSSSLVRCLSVSTNTDKPGAKDFTGGWKPQKRLSRADMDRIRFLRKEFPAEHSISKLSEQFKVSVTAVQRILRSKWQPTEEQSIRQEASKKQQALLAAEINRFATQHLGQPPARRPPAPAPTTAKEQQIKFGTVRARLDPSDAVEQEFDQHPQQQQQQQQKERQRRYQSSWKKLEKSGGYGSRRELNRTVRRTSAAASYKERSSTTKRFVHSASSVSTAVWSLGLN